MKKKFAVFALVLGTILSCREKSDPKPDDTNKMNNTVTFQDDSFGHDVTFLKKWDPMVIILGSKDAKVAVSSKYQAKVFTSTASGENGKSLGWINYGAFEKEDPHMNAYGGENRFWLGPEGNTFSLFFKPKDELVFENWKTPAPMDSKPWKMVKKTETAVAMEMEMELKNYADHDFKIRAQRKVALLSREEMEELLGSEIGSGLQSVGYKTENKITNIGNRAWTEETGAPCIWILDMFPPSDNTVIFIPYNNGVGGEVATTDYFGEIPKDRITYGDGMLFFRADGRSRGKLGIPPIRATHLAGSYDAVNQVLTITVFDVDPDAVYLNQEWNLESDPFKGDAINAYNDGPLEDGSQMGPFYELESVSPAAFLDPKESLSHDHTVLHFVGGTTQLDQIVRNVFGITIKEITNAL